MNQLDDTAPMYAKVLADFEAPDRILYGLTARQLAILATATALSYLAWQATATRLPLPLIAAGIIPILGVATMLALGRRDGLTLDVWLWAAIAHRRAPRRAVPAAEGIVDAPPWAPSSMNSDGDSAGDGPAPAVLRLPARTIDDSGTVDTGDSAVVLVAATTVNLGLRTGAEQNALIGGYARWLNALTGPVQVVVSAQRVDLTGHAQRVADAAQAITDPALAEAALDYAEFLLDVAEHRDPLWRTVTIACAGTGGHTAATRRAAARRTHRRRAARPRLPDPGPGRPDRHRRAHRRRRPLPAQRRLLAPRHPQPAGHRPAPRPHGAPTMTNSTEPTPTTEETTAPSRRARRAARQTARAAANHAAGAVTASIGPASIETAPRHVRVGDGYAATLIVTGYPAEVGPAWLEPLLAWPGRLDVALHIEPLAPQVAATRLRRQRARLESNRRVDAERGRLGDPITDAAAEDAADLADRVARGMARLFRVGLYLHRPRPDRGRADRGGRRSPRRRRLGAAGHPAGDLAAAAGLDLHPAAGHGQPADAPRHGHRRARRRVPARLRRPARAAAGRGRAGRRGALRVEHRLRRGGVVGPLGAGQPQLRRRRPAPAPARATSSSWRSCGRCTTGCRSRSSTPKTNTCASPKPSAAPRSNSAPPASGSTRSTSRPGTGAPTR